MSDEWFTDYIEIIPFDEKGEQQPSEYYYASVNKEDPTLMFECRDNETADNLTALLNQYCEEIEHYKNIKQPIN